MTRHVGGAREEWKGNARHDSFGQSSYARRSHQHAAVHWLHGILLGFHCREPSLNSLQSLEQRLRCRCHLSRAAHAFGDLHRSASRRRGLALRGAHASHHTSCIELANLLGELLVTEQLVIEDPLQPSYSSRKVCGEDRRLCLSRRVQRLSIS